ncbi:MAG: hypothetical protein GF393_00955 [Armatimonadia bacterium]|nr:hypothetical protein [Armatimonadia bacterium]
MPEMSGPVIVLIGIIVLAVLARLTAWVLDRGPTPYGPVDDLLRALIAGNDECARKHVAGDWDDVARAYVQGMGRMVAAPRGGGPFKLRSASVEDDRATVVVEVSMLPGMEALVGEQSMTVPHVVVAADDGWLVDLHETERGLRKDPMHRLVFADPDGSSEEWWGGEEP